MLHRMRRHVTEGMLTDAPAGLAFVEVESIVNEPAPPCPFDLQCIPSTVSGK